MSKTDIVKKKTDHTKGDWFQLLLEDFKFVEDTMDEEKLNKCPKIEYKKKVTEMVTKAAFNYFTKEKEGHKKVKDLE